MLIHSPKARCANLTLAKINNVHVINCDLVNMSEKYENNDEPYDEKKNASVSCQTINPRKTLKFNG